MMSSDLSKPRQACIRLGRSMSKKEVVVAELIRKMILILTQILALMIAAKRTHSKTSKLKMSVQDLGNNQKGFNLGKCTRMNNIMVRMRAAVRSRMMRNKTQISLSSVRNLVAVAVKAMSVVLVKVQGKAKRKRRRQKGQRD